MATSTKQRILDTSIRLFNEHGVDAVRLQQIAEEIGISVGNLAYHFRTKDAIVESAYDQLLDEFAYIFRQYLQAPELNAFDGQLSLYYRFFQRYQFYLADFFKQAKLPTEQRASWQQAINKMLIQLRSWLDFHVQRGMIRPEQSRGQHDQLAETLWTALIFLPVSYTMRGRPCDEITYKQAVWQCLTPYLTEEGIAEFQTHVWPLID